VHQVRDWYSGAAAYFGWQAGYGAFSVGVSQLAETVAYICRQEEHHRTKSFQEEYFGFLRKHGYSDHLLAHHSPRPSGTGPI
jgi:hypothetical protein